MSCEPVSIMLQIPDLGQLFLYSSRAWSVEDA